MWCFRMVVSILTVAFLCMPAKSADSAEELPRLPRMCIIKKDKKDALTFNLRMKDAVKESVKVPARLPIYRVAKPAFDMMFIEGFCNVTFGENPSKFTKDGTTTFVKLSAPRSTVEFDQETGRIVATLRANQVDKTSVKLTEELGKRLAEAALSRHHINIDDTELFQISLSSDVMPIGYYLSYVRKLNGLRVFDNTLSIHITPEGKLCMFSIQWWDFREIGKYS